MSVKINVLDINIDNCTAKDAMKAAVEYMESEPVNIIEMVTVDSVMQMDEVPSLKEAVSGFDVVLAGECTILEAAGITERKCLQETESRIFIKMFLRYLHKHHKRIYLLVESEEEGRITYDYLERYYSGLQMIGMAKMSAENRADDMIVNAINGGEIDCVLSILSSPLQEEFIVKNRCLLNSRVWFGLGKGMLPVKKDGFGQNRFAQYLMKRILKKEMEKRQKNPLVTMPIDENEK